MVDKGGHAQSASWAIAEHAESVEQIAKIIPPFVEQLTEFWSAAGQSCEYHLQDLRKLKGVFGEDLFPSYTNNIASSTSIYLDTIILTDPFMNSAKMFDVWDSKVSVRYFVKHGLNVLAYKNLVLADIDPPIAVICPFKSSFDESEAEMVMSISEPDILKHGTALFNIKFASLDEMRNYTNRLNTIYDAIEAICRPDRFLFDTEWTGSLKDQLSRVLKDDSAGFRIKYPGQYLFVQSV